jgi:hypothetical protein
MPKIWVLREAFLAYERFHGIFSSLEDAKLKAPDGIWKSVQRTLPDYMFDDRDPFNSAPGAIYIDFGTSLWIIEPYELR